MERQSEDEECRSWHCLRLGKLPGMGDREAAKFKRKAIRATIGMRG